MMPAIRVENLSKQYRIGVRSKRAHDTLTDLVSGAASSLWRKLRGRQNTGVTIPIRHGSHESDGTFWALRDVNFDVQPGEVVGIIGRNGAGKSTLLKILSRITEPTSGQIELEGRVASLLEVGTGFHPDLSGRENIYLNGSLLGMSRREVSQRFDEIVSFSEIEEFLETPVKRYSSGMYVRLAFGVAAHLRTEVLLLDEVLAVGDIAFQKKCLGKMDSIAQGGRTIIFVSHQMNQIRRLCSQCVWMHAGQVREFGGTNDIIGAYESAMLSSDDDELRGVENGRLGTRFMGWKIVDPESQRPNELATLLPCSVAFRIKVDRKIRRGIHGIALINNTDQLIWGFAVYDLAIEPGVHDFIYHFPSLPLRPGAYRWHLTIWEEDQLIDNWYGVPEFIISAEPVTHPRDEWSGILNLPCAFNISTLDQF